MIDLLESFIFVFLPNILACSSKSKFSIFYKKINEEITIQSIYTLFERTFEYKIKINMTHANVNT